MLLYNVTVKIDRNIQEDWLQWMRSTHIPRMKREGQFIGHRICRLLGTDESDGFTYAVQYLCPDKSVFRTYQLEQKDKMEAAMMERFPNQFVHFSSLLEIIE